ncbi:MAG: hypothetical protein PVG14_06545 [Anaerolineales bacterium]|jgi:hypothetical protein
MKNKRSHSESKRIKEILAIAAAAYPTYELSAPTIKIYARMLSDIPPEVLEQAVLYHIDHCKFFPTISELRDAYFEIIQLGRSVPTAYDAWREVTRQIIDTGSFSSPKFSHHLIMKAVEGVGGWRNLCRSTNQTADRARFLEAYEAYVQRALNRARTHPQIKARAAQLSDQRPLLAPNWPKTKEG